MIDEIINNTQSNSYDKEAYRQKKKEQLEIAYGTIKDGINELKTNPSFFKDYLNIQSRFDMYTPRNAILVAKQLPTATQLKEWSKWRDSNVTFKERYPKKILLLDPREPYRNKNGDLIKSYTAKEVIDVSETNVKPTNRSYDRKYILQALLHDCPVDIKAVDELSSGKISEWNAEDNAIYVCRGKDVDLTIKSVVEEIAKINLYENNEIIDADKVECISYMVCSRYGIKVELNNMEKFTSKYSNMEAEDIVADLYSMKNIVLDINTKMMQYISDKKKNLENKEQGR